MQTTYMLAGGSDSKYEDFGRKLAAAVSSIHAGHLRIVSCSFAWPREEWEKKFVERQAWLKRLFGGDTEVTLALPTKFEAQVRTADVVYLHGGDSVLLAHYLDQLAEPQQLFAGKIIIGSSAGANWLSTAYWSGAWREARRGAGIVPQNIMVHYGKAAWPEDLRGPIDWAKAEAELRAIIPVGSQITYLPEGEFVVVTQ